MSPTAPASSYESVFATTGVMLTTFAPALVLFPTVVAAQPELIILMVGAAFIWLVAISLVSLVWSVLVPVRSMLWLLVLYGVVAQEGSRWGTYLLYGRLMRGLQARGLQPSLGPVVAPSRLAQTVPPAVACGLGVGVAQTIILHGDVLIASLQPGTLYAAGCSSLSVFALDALCSLGMLVLNVALTVLGWSVAYPRRSRGLGAAIVALHLLASGATLLNGAGSVGGVDGCLVALPCLFGTVALAVGVATRAVTGGTRLLATSTAQSHAAPN